MQRIALLGLGIMGSGMAASWLRAGFPLAVWNRTRARAEPLAAAGATLAATPREAAAGADVVWSMVADDEASRAVWQGPDGALAGLKPGAVAIESSTLTPDWIRDLASQASAAGGRFLDSPVMGSRDAAAGGQLVLYVGGEAATLAGIRPALEAVSSRIHHLGPVGTGATWKLIANMMGAVHTAMAAEALQLAEKAGFDRAVAAEMIAGGATGSGIVQRKMPRIAGRDFADPDFPLRLILKDQRYGMRLAEQLGLRLDLVPAAAAVFRRAEEAGHGDEDYAAVVTAAAPPR